MCRLCGGNDIAVVIGQDFRLMMVVNLRILFRNGFLIKPLKVPTWEVESGDLTIVSLGVHGVTSLVNARLKLNPSGGTKIAVQNQTFEIEPPEFVL